MIKEKEICQLYIENMFRRVSDDLYSTLSLLAEQNHLNICVHAPESPLIYTDPLDVNLLPWHSQLYNIRHLWFR